MSVITKQKTKGALYMTSYRNCDTSSVLLSRAGSPTLHAATAIPQSTSLAPIGQARAGMIFSQRPSKR